MASSAFRKPFLFVDTWGWLALEDGKDAAHERVLQHYREFRHRSGQAVTTDYVLDETMTRLFSRRPFTEARQFMEGLWSAAEKNYLIIQRITTQRFQEAWQLRLRYRDKPGISFTDLTSFAVMCELRISAVLTDDHHFEQVNLGLALQPR